MVCAIRSRKAAQSNHPHHLKEPQEIFDVQEIDCNEEEEQEEEEQLSSEEEESKEDFHNTIRELRAYINDGMKTMSHFNRKMFHQWITGTLNGRYWLNNHYGVGCGGGKVTLVYPNGDVYVDGFSYY